MRYKLSNGYNRDIYEQVMLLETIIFSSDTLSKVLERAKELNIENYYIGAGCITQTVWNYLSDKPLDYGIKDIDFVYFDDKDLSYASEDTVISKVKELYSDLGTEVDIKNEARVHLWYKSRFGYEVEPYDSLEAAINTWPTTATSIGVKKTGKGFKVYAPFGLNDLFGKIVRANKVRITPQIYEGKVREWLKKWPDLTVVEWDKC